MIYPLYLSLTNKLSSILRVNSIEASTNLYFFLIVVNNFFLSASGMANKNTKSPLSKLSLNYSCFYAGILFS